MKKLICLLLTLTLICALAACGSKTEDTAKETAPATTETKTETKPQTAEDKQSETAAQSAQEEAQPEKVTLTTGTQEDASKIAEITESFVGDWVCEDTNLHIEQKGDNFAVEIKNGEGVTWAYECHLIGTLLICNEIGVSKSASGDTVFEDGTASFSIGSDGKLYWDDYKNFSGNGLAFAKA